MTLDERKRRFHAMVGLQREHMTRNLAGYVTRDYSVETDSFDFVFGAFRWRNLDQQDDPLAGREDTTLEEFFQYLETWYWPKRQALAARGPILVSAERK